MKQYLLAFIGIIFSFPLFAQTPDYDVEVLTAPYADLDNPTPLVTEIWDDPQIDISLPFPFIFMGDTLKEISTNGDIGMIFYSTDDQRLLAAYLSDLIDRGTGTNASLSPISSQLTGAVGNRILKLEWKNAGFYFEAYINNGRYDDFVNVQLWFYEADHAFEVRFGPSKTDQPIAEIHDLGGPTCGYGILDINTYQGSLWTLAGDPLKPEQMYTVIDYNSYYEIPVLTAHPNDGTVYRFTASATVATEEIKPATYLTVFPTQVSQELYIKWNQGATVEGEVQIIDVAGKVHQAQSLRDHLSTINCSSLSAGIYFLQWQNKEGLMKTFKFVKN